MRTTGGTRTFLGVLASGLLLATLGVAPSSAAAAVSGFVRVDQAGFAPGESKHAYVMTTARIGKAGFAVVDEAARQVLSGRVDTTSRGAWSAAYPASQHLLEHARRIRCRVWFTQQWHDEIIDRAGAADLFDAIGSDDKRLVAYPGGHRELEGGRLADAVRFVAESLVRA